MAKATKGDTNKELFERRLGLANLFVTLVNVAATGLISLFIHLNSTSLTQQLAAQNETFTKDFAELQIKLQQSMFDIKPDCSIECSITFTNNGIVPAEDVKTIITFHAITDLWKKYIHKMDFFRVTVSPPTLEVSVSYAHFEQVDAYNENNNGIEIRITKIPPQGQAVIYLTLDDEVLISNLEFHKKLFQIDIVNSPIPDLSKISDTLYEYIYSHYKLADFDLNLTCSNCMSHKPISFTMNGTKELALETGYSPKKNRLAFYITMKFTIPRREQFQVNSSPEYLTATFDENTREYKLTKP